MKLVLFKKVEFSFLSSVIEVVISDRCEYGSKDTAVDISLFERKRGEKRFESSGDRN